MVVVAVVRTVDAVADVLVVARHLMMTRNVVVERGGYLSCSWLLLVSLLLVTLVVEVVAAVVAGTGADGS